ncbi:hypothetical protein CLCR_00027 [Cladophialophora carrionii]|uniref:Uncharacterized protein n=1 Tax=Cladophialophora carrionii TaxID=86049 RepID=A0A1C1D312_9EURO|nr:hypothetical protein CLCR_00027 [Cladophialophora carrionii]
MATWGFFIAPGDELFYDSGVTTDADQKPILVKNRAPLVVDRLRVKRDAAARPIRGRNERFLWEWWDPDQDEWLEIGLASGPKELEEKVFDFFVRAFGGWDVTGPDGSIKRGIGSWDRFSWVRAGVFGPQTLGSCRSEYWEQQRAHHQQQPQQQQQ